MLSFVFDASLRWTLLSHRRAHHHVSTAIVSVTYFPGKKIRRIVGASDIAGLETQTADYSRNGSRFLSDQKALGLDPIHQLAVAIVASQRQLMSFAAVVAEFPAAE